MVRKHAVYEADCINYQSGYSAEVLTLRAEDDIRTWQGLIVSSTIIGRQVGWIVAPDRAEPRRDWLGEPSICLDDYVYAALDAIMIAQSGDDDSLRWEAA